MTLHGFAAVVSALIVVQPSFCAVRGKKAEYRGGTVKSLSVGMQGQLDVEDPKEMVFRMEHGKEWRLPYARITALQYGGRTGHRTGAGLAVGVAVGVLPGLIVAFSHKTKHYLAIGFKEADGTPGAAVFELAKEGAWTTVNSLEVETHIRAEEVDGEKLKAGNVMPMPRPTTVPVRQAEVVAPTPTPTPRPTPPPPEAGTRVIRL